jgi:glycosyltransferase involved in cell wall biosynthesis
MPKIVCLLGSHAPSLVRFRGPLVSALATRGHEVIAAAPEIDAPMRAQIRALGADPVRVPMARTGTNPLEDLALCRDLAALFEVREPHAVIPYTAKPVIWGSIAARRAGVPLIAPIITGLGYAFSGDASAKRLLVRQVVSLGYRRALAGAHKVFFQNPDDLSLFRTRGLLPDTVDAIVTNGSGVDLERFAIAPLPEAPVFIMIARLLRAKGVLDYAEAAARVAKAVPGAKFRLVGWIDRSPDAIRASELDRLIASGIEHLGHLDDVRPAIAQASVCVLPSYYGEGTPRSLLEAMAMGRPVITTDTPGCKETVVDGENGILVPVRAPAALAAAMIRLAADPAARARMGSASRRIAEARYDVHEVNATILTALDL